MCFEWLNVWSDLMGTYLWLRIGLIRFDGNIFVTDDWSDQIWWEHICDWWLVWSDLMGTYLWLMIGLIRFDGNIFLSIKRCFMYTENDKNGRGDSEELIFDAYSERWFGKLLRLALSIWFLYKFRILSFVWAPL